MILTPTEIFIMAVYFLSLYFSIFWLLVLFEKEEPRKQTDLKHTPHFSVLIPAWNEEETVVGTINSALNLDYPKQKLEIIIVNDGSTDRTKEIVENYIKLHGKVPK